MFGTMGFSELIIILAIILIIFGAGRLPQIGEGVGKALKGFKKEVHDAPQPAVAQTQQDMSPGQDTPPLPTPSVMTQEDTTKAASGTGLFRPASVPGPEMTPGTTASLLYNQEPPPPQPRQTVTQRESPASGMPVQQVVSMEDRANTPARTNRPQYPPLPPGSAAKPAVKRPSAIVNKDAVARVQAQQSAMKAKAVQPQGGMSPDDLQQAGEGVGDVLRTFRQAVADVRNSLDPEMRTIQAEMDATQKELRQSLEAAQHAPAAQEDPPKRA